jgi:cation diffusion facilitator family transporter
MIGTGELAQRRRESQTAIGIGLVANIALAAAKTAAGIVGRSSALVSDGINSISDTVYYVLVASFVRHASEPADREHPYGHAQMESIASLVVGAFVLTTAVAILWSEVTTLFGMITRGGTRDIGAIALWVAVATVAVKAVLSWWTRARGKATDNTVLVALGDDHATDLAASGAVAVGILLARRGAPWVDPAAGAVVGLLIFRTGLRILRNAATDLMDAVPSESLAREIRAVLAQVPAIRQVEEIQAHRFGPYFVVNLTIGLDGSLTIAEGDRVCTQVERTIYDSIPEIRRVHVHYHPPRARAGGRAGRDLQAGRSAGS